MNQSISEIQRLLQEVVGHLSSGTKMDARKAVAKLERIAALASTAALTIQVQRSAGSQVFRFPCPLDATVIPCVCINRRQAPHAPE